MSDPGGTPFLLVSDPILHHPSFPAPKAPEKKFLGFPRTATLNPGERSEPGGKNCNFLWIPVLSIHSYTLGGGPPWPSQNVPPTSQCAEALGGVPQVPGRLARFVLPGGGLAVVDYAHTHDALAAVLKACDELNDRRLLVVFGCGGDRDRGKRPLMGQVAARESDRAWITSDNPRSEEPGGICRDIMAGFDEVTEPRATGRELVIDRREMRLVSISSDIQS